MFINRKRNMLNLKCLYLIEKLIILLNPKKAYIFFQQLVGKVINCIFSNIFIPYRLILLYFFNLY